MKYKKQCLADGGDYCPFCECPDINEEQLMDSESGYLDVRMYCCQCRKKWWAVYRLCDLEEIENQ